MAGNYTIINGSICITDIIDLMTKGHSAFKRSSKNQKVYMNITEFINEDADEYGNHSSYKLNSSKEKREEEKKANGGKDHYIGNGKRVDIGGEQVQANSSDADALKKATENLPF